MKRKRLLSGCLILAGGFILLLCSINTTMFFVIPTINQNKWNDLKPQNYSLTVNYGSVMGMFRAYRETVIDRAAKRDDPYFSPHEPTIDELFDRIKANTLNPLALLLYSIEYDPVYGFPLRIEEVDFDLGDITEITEFTPE